MVGQFSLPKAIRERSKKRPDVENVSVVSEVAQNAPKLGLYLAKKLFGSGTDPRSIYKQTGWYQDLDGQWLYSTGDQNMKLSDNPLINLPSEQPTYGVQPTDAKKPGDPARMYEQPGIPMKHDPVVDPVGPKGGRGVYRTIGANRKPRWEEESWDQEVTREADPIGEMVPSPYGPELGKRYPNDSTWEKQQPPQQMPIYSMKQRMYPDIYDNPDQMTFQQDYLTGRDNYDAWDQWEPPGFDPVKQRDNNPRNPRFGELVDHRTLFELSPEAADPFTAANYTFGGPQDYGGSFIDIGSGMIDAQGRKGGVTVPNSLESVLLHEGGHKNQRTYEMPRGGNDAEAGMAKRGEDMAIDAGQRFRDLLNMQQTEVDKLVNFGIEPDKAEEMVAKFYPNINKMLQKYSMVSGGYPNDPNALNGVATAATPEYLGYRGEAGEVQSKNLQTRASTLQNNIPMTGGSREAQFQPNSDPARSADFGHLMDDRPHEGDVHPLDTYQIPPDLTRLRYDQPGGAAPREVMPRLGEYDWMLKGPAIGAAVLGVGGAMTPGLAEAAPIDRDALAAKLAPNPERFGRQPGEPSPHQLSREEQLEVGREVPAMIGTGGRTALEGTLGMGGDLSFDTGYGFSLPLGANFLPGSEKIKEVGEGLQGYLPQTLQDWLKTYTQAEPKTQQGAAIRKAAEWSMF